MGEKFDQIRAKSRIDNYLAGTSTAPDKPAAGADGGTGPVAGPGEVRQDAAVRPTSGG